MENFKSMASYNYFQSGKVGAIYIATAAPGFVFLKAEVTPSLAVNSTKHSAWVLTTDEGVVETAGCTCTAGQGRSCSHVGAVLWKLDYAASTGRSGYACTDTEMRWNQGTSRNLEPKRLSNIRFKRHKPNSSFSKDRTAAVTMIHLPPIPQYLTHEDFRHQVSQSSVRRLFQLPGSMTSKSYNATLSAPVNDRILTVHDNHTTGTLSCKKCSEFYLRYVNVDRDMLEEKTKNQAELTLWHDARKLRLTASSAKKVPVRASTDPDAFLREHLYPTFRGNSATQHGRESEPTALKKLEELGFPTIKMGTVRSRTEPWLSASPDGMVCGESNTLVEVKCPLKGSSSLSELLESGKSVCDIKFVDGQPVLKNGPRGYFLQTQIGMHCTDTKQTKFFVWTKENHVLIDVAYDQQYVQEIVKRLERFYFNTMLPRIVDDFSEGRLKLCAEYRTLTPSHNPN